MGIYSSKSPADCESYFAVVFRMQYFISSGGTLGQPWNGFGASFICLFVLTRSARYKTTVFYIFVSIKLSYLSCCGCIIVYSMHTYTVSRHVLYFTCWKQFFQKLYDWNARNVENSLPFFKVRRFALWSGLRRTVENSYRPRFAH